MLVAKDDVVILCHVYSLKTLHHIKI